MRTRTNQELGIKWFYWLITAVWVVFAGGALWVAIQGDSQDDKKAGWIAGIMFSGIAVCALLWPVLRKREREGVQVEIVRTPEIYCEAILIPASRVKRIILFVGALFLGSGALAILFQTDNWEYRAKGAIAAVVYLAIISLGIRDCFAPRHGIVLLPNGLIWREMFRASCLIPWDTLSSGGPQPLNHRAQKLSLGLSRPRGSFFSRCRLRFHHFGKRE